ncbi:ankyrin repeat-containing domain protein [Jimgerdemannia flammicorona]|uniref:Ankyrin repeat-containing domain protein n=1 Tax=Jimgerdemannia flammicorona TaxID=994334 RepID=A0A433D0H9_9FUNG|nr:ankyrin repeat-containing domain protein [Jimgerdemannia flammicorona]
MSIIRQLIQSPTLNVNQKCGPYEFTALHLACKYDNTEEIAKYLIRVGQVDINQHDDNGRTPLHIAARYGHINVIQYFLQCEDIIVDERAVEDGREFLGDMALHFAFNDGHFEIVKLLVESGKADVNHYNDNGLTLLQKAIIMNDMRMVKYLIRCPSIDVNRSSYFEKYTALHYVCSKKDMLAISRYLIQVGLVNIHQRDEYNQTPFEVIEGLSQRQQFKLIELYQQTK